MDLRELVPVLRCLECGGELRAETASLDCPGCGRSYRIVEGVPLMVEADAEADVWAGYFRTLAGRRGDSESANSYFNVRSFRIVRDNLLDLIGRTRGLAILDIGCGTGHFSQSLAEENRVVGVDISLEMALFAKRKGLATVQSSGKKLPFARETFDLVIANNVIQSLVEGAPFVLEAARVLRPNGRLILSATNGQNLTMAFFRWFERRKYRHLGVYSAGKLRRLIQAAGLKPASLLFFYFPTNGAAAVPGDARIGWLRKGFATTVAVEAVKPA